MQASATSLFGLTVDDIHAWFDLATELLDINRDTLNQANVFPVADADTGTNMLLTLRGGTRQLVREEPATAAQALHEVAQGALINARGNSGIILAEYLRGFAHATTQQHFFDHEEHLQLTAALESAKKFAYAAVADPVEGTILSIAQAAATGATDPSPVRNTDDNTDASTEEQARTVTHDTIRNAVEQARTSLEQTPKHLDILNRSHVLDAGAFGLVLVLTALESVIAHVPAQFRSDLVAPALQNNTAHDNTNGAKQPSPTHGKANPHNHGVTSHDFHDETIVDGEFEVMFLLHAATHEEHAQTISSTLRHRLQDIGESVVVIGGYTHTHNALWNVHVHTDTPHAALDAAHDTCATATTYSIAQVLVRDLVRQVSQTTHTHKTPTQKSADIIACTSAPGLVPDIARTGAIVLLETDLTLTSSDVGRALSEGTGNGAVVITNSQHLAQSVHDVYPDIAVIAATDDAQVVAAVTALNLACTNNPHSSQHELARIGEHSLTETTTIRLDNPTHEELQKDVLKHLEHNSSHNTIPIVTVLSDTHCALALLADFTARLEHIQPNAELISLPSGRRGTGLTISLEWVHA
ncbi:DAK2 domain-containing protein [Timonella sp. A28]|uniref:DAK2 domain-containing protein n=1 Tax=Timonella sp. A28 TaxID=3442640 RepID=UPI003EBADC3E